MTAPAAPAPTLWPWRGWFRANSRQKWKAVVSANTADEAWDQMLRYPLSGDKTVSQRDPNLEKCRR